MRRHAFFIGILIVIAGVRFAILFLSQTDVQSDEASAPMCRGTPLSVRALEFRSGAEKLSAAFSARHLL
jgi:hypothetical protein